MSITELKEILNIKQVKKVLVCFKGTYRAIAYFAQDRNGELYVKETTYGGAKWYYKDRDHTGTTYWWWFLEDGKLEKDWTFRLK